MSVNRTPAGNAATYIPELACGAPSASSCTDQSHWRQARLVEARGILADIVHHPDTLVLLACRVIFDNSRDAGDRIDALGVMRLLNRQPLETVSTFPKGGVA